MLFAVTTLADPTVLLEKVEVPLTVNMSPDTRLSAYVTEAASVLSYVLLLAVMVTDNDR